MGTRFTEGELDDLLDQLDLEELDLINRYVDPDVSIICVFFLLLYVYRRVRLKLPKRGSCKSGVFHSREVIFWQVGYFCIINCLT